MATQEVKRKLTAILSADMVRDSRLMGTQLIVKDAKMTERGQNLGHF